MIGGDPRPPRPTASGSQSVPRLASEPGDDKTKVHEHTEIGIVVGAARTPAAVAMQSSAALPPAAEQPAPATPTAPRSGVDIMASSAAEQPAPAPRAATSPTSTHRGLPAVERQPGPMPDDYAQLLARHHALHERYEELVEQHEQVLERYGTLLTWLEGRVVRLERKLADDRHKLEEQAAELAALRESLRKSQAARNAVLLLLQEMALDPPDTEPFRAMSSAALAAIAVARTAQPSTTGSAT